MNITLVNKEIIIVDGNKTITANENNLVSIKLKPNYILMKIDNNVVEPDFKIYRSDVVVPTSTSLADLYSQLSMYYNIVKNPKSLDAICEVLETEAAINAAYPNGQTGQLAGSAATGTIFKWSGSAWVNTNIPYTPAVATTSVPGYMSAADKTKLDGVAASANVGVVPNVAITGATKTKIEYDSKGLVISGSDATTADIAVSTNKNYVTDAELATLVGTGATEGYILKIVSGVPTWVSPT